MSKPIDVSDIVAAHGLDALDDLIAHAVPVDDPRARLTLYSSKDIPPDDRPPPEDRDEPPPGAPSEEDSEPTDGPNDGPRTLREIHRCDCVTANAVLVAALAALAASIPDHDIVTKDKDDMKAVAVKVAATLLDAAPILAWLAALETAAWEKAMCALSAFRGFHESSRSVRRAVNAESKQHAAALKAERAEHSRSVRQKETAKARANTHVYSLLSRKILASGEEGPPAASQLNAEIILENDPTWAGKLRYNDFQSVIERGSRTMFEARRMEEMTDVAEYNMISWIDRAYGIELPTEKVRAGIAVVAHRNKYHPIRDYLDGLTWDGVPRIDDFLTDCMGAKEDRLNRQLSRCFLISCVARIYNPGCQVDTTLILVGMQGTGKSTAFSALCGACEWFNESKIDLSSKDRFSSIEGVWLYEMAELAGLGRAEVNALKSFLSNRVDKYRPAYGRNDVRRPRQLVFIGTTNDIEFLHDTTGSRRFWPVLQARKGAPCDVDRIKRDRDQFWAEAVVALRKGDPWHLNAADDAEIAERADAHRVLHPWERKIRQFLVDLPPLTLPGGRSTDEFDQWMKMPGHFHIADVLAAIGIELPKQREQDSAKVGSILSGVYGCQKQRVRMDGAQQMRWFPPRDTDGRIALPEFAPKT